ncbi:hypothetical protein U6G28_04050 [Actinomycetaceae bacterium MB13-C1-2]|nr:hypothetical protein U6G28_04050 [Actinomycetaceae bacterium MB13-C1-2]
MQSSQIEPSDSVAPSIKVLEDQVHRTCADLRFAEGLRRGWEEARAEAAVQEAVLLAWMEGARGSATELREMTMRIEQGQSPDEDTEAASAAMLGIWRAVWHLESELPPLNTRDARTTGSRAVPSVLASLNKEICSFLVATGQMSGTKVAVPQEPDVLRSIMRVADDTSVSATARSAEVLRLMLTSKPFAFGNLPTGFLFVKWLLARTGVEPTGVAILSARASQNQQKFSALMELGSTEQWHRFLLESLIDGCASGKLIARSVQAGQTLDYSN